jgi:hypothetical protein
MEYGSSHVCVLGIGHLAAAVRVRLRHLTPLVCDPDCNINLERPALFLACSDFENTSLRRALGERARKDRCAIVFACLVGDSVRVGPLISSCSQHKSTSRYLTRSWDFSRRDTSMFFARGGEWVAHSADTRGTHMAQIGATFVVGELAKVLSDLRRSLPVARVTKNDAPTNFSEWVFARGSADDGGSDDDPSFVAMTDGTLVAVDGWQEVCGFPARTWHPGGIGGR